MCFGENFSIRLQCRFRSPLHIVPVYRRYGQDFPHLHSCKPAVHATDLTGGYATGHVY